MLDHGPSILPANLPAVTLDLGGSAASWSEPARVAPVLRVGLLNNMPDSALVQTERQFRRLIGSGVDLRLFSLETVPRGPLARAHLDRFYATEGALAGAGLDALVVTGAEPRARQLADEPFFSALTAVVDWAASNAVPTLFSCLAAHAAVLHLDHIERRPLPAKHSGVYACAAVADHPLLAGMPASVPVPHSRWNDLPEAELTARGYRILRRSDAVGVDLFIRERAGSAPMVFLQGHPEYEGDTLAREYRRDMGRFLDGERETCPALPENYYTDQSVRHLDAFAATARAYRSSALHADFPTMAETPPRLAGWQEGAAGLFRNWLAFASARAALAA
ncbi:homoserine O-succinyltransferase [Methylorubrum rhodesianum]|jgi:homoserine O-succinyltransferase/O-acetyltransferase|uniref:Homoserine O-succinyltransferase n=1 Tax=Methylorubrum rhodesianum TaxID=29427 RepID=A0ABU9ZK09_9HYPH|nr:MULTISPECIES: homoserine O-succinyltransferase [Methylorubrum]MBB5762282.1 homoserine O-succinyltransferase [Methylorubrum rhodesianum]MBI1688250.1 homoserine O-succinyltransferase [Methylorubrum sp. DB1722]MBK3405482.1 homoserine O-succinyltransferase [Methylorubrum rhodesianum]MBY0139330.1 homoserine O-succinyltransferase [Methylorubrum populi]